MNVLKWIVGSTFAAASGALLAFGPRGDAPPGPGLVVVVVDYWEKWTGNEADQMRGIVDDFNRTEGRAKRIYVRYVSMASINQKTLVATAGGTPPDIAGLYDSNLV